MQLGRCSLPQRCLSRLPAAAAGAGAASAAAAAGAARPTSAAAAAAGAGSTAGAAGAPTAAAGAGVAAPLAAYVHLPFCKRKCFYCDFPVEAMGPRPGKPRAQERMESYIELLCAEIGATAALGQQPLQTVYFGGGTPSLVPPQLVERVLGALQRRFGIAASAEVSFEADPGTFDVQRLCAYKALGINRLSMGVQCFQEELLQLCGRSHSLADVYAAIDAVHSAGLPSWSLDLISGLPRLGVDAWRHSLAEAVAAQPDHVSVYDLQVEDGTPFARWFAGSPALPQEPDAVAMYELASSTLASAGYVHYEISNYAKPGHESRHNRVYWRCQPYYAFGLGAASYTRGRRFSRPRDMAQYERWVRQYVSDGGGCPGAALPEESQEERLLDLLMLSLRTAEGLDLQALQREFGSAPATALLPTIGKACARGLMQLLDRSGSSGSGAQQSSQGAVDEAAAAAAVQQLLLERVRGGGDARVRLTDPAGFLLSNDVISDLFAQLDPAMLQQR